MRPPSRQELYDDEWLPTEPAAAAPSPPGGGGGGGGATAMTMATAGPWSRGGWESAAEADARTGRCAALLANLQAERPASDVVLVPAPCVWGGACMYVCVCVCAVWAMLELV
jgi:hypothetical protein